MTYPDGLQAALAAEHASIFVVGYLGAQTSASAQPALFADLHESLDLHRTRRDQLDALVRQAGAEPVAAAASYDIPDVAGDPRRISAGAVAVEQACGAAYGFLVANSPSPQRRWAIKALRDCALRELQFGGRPRAFPGR